MPKAYVICDITVTDEERYGDYRALSGPAVAQYGGRFIVRGGPTSLLEGDRLPQRTVVIEFESEEAARRWYDSPEYQAARAIREPVSTATFLLAVGVE